MYNKNNGYSEYNEKERNMPQAKAIYEGAKETTEKMIENYLLGQKAIHEKYYLERDYVRYEDGKYYGFPDVDPIKFAREDVDMIWTALNLGWEQSHNKCKQTWGHLMFSFGSNDYLKKHFEESLKRNQRTFKEALKIYEQERKEKDESAKNAKLKWFSNIKKSISEDHIKKVEKYIEMLKPIKGKFLEEFNFCSQQLENFKNTLPELRKDINLKIGICEKLVHSRAEYEKARMQSNAPIKEASDELEKLYKIIGENLDRGIKNKFCSIRNKIKSEYPEVPAFDSFDIYKIPKLKLTVFQDERHEESKEGHHQIDSGSSISAIDKLKSDFERYLELHSHDQDSAALIQMQGVINSLHESIHHQ